MLQLQMGTAVFSHRPENFRIGTSVQIQIASDHFFLQQYQVPLWIDASDPWREWLLAKHTRWWLGKANMYYHWLITSYNMAHQCNQRWNLKKNDSWWHARFRDIWDSSYSFKMKVFMWRMFVGLFTLGAFLCKHGVKGVRCSHCASYAENMRHAFSLCPHIQRWWNALLLFPIWDVKPTKFNCTFLLFTSVDNAVNWSNNNARIG
ncbi:hypothetical protein KP509_17G023300 [Ceratopteris richardii]|uniref:Reverse transcriptase zinc-binding domain-containing protein n=1 Tax=Ceratopteris richardii TaxID=49495 RepID=A0A8T2STI7_CERRI|nr:hypothetical protein KP509_17G023300 [Ceratopteris richardii]